MFVIKMINCLVFLFGSDLSSCLFSFLPFSFHAMLMGAEFGLQFADNIARPVQNRKKQMLKWLDARNSGALGAQSYSTIVSYPASPLLLSYPGFLFDCHNDSNDKNGFNSFNHTNQSQRRNPQRLPLQFRSD